MEKIRYSNIHLSLRQCKMTPMEEFYLKMGFLDCLQMYAQAAPNPEQAIIKRMFVQEKMIPDVLPNVPREEILRRIDEIVSKKFSEEMVIKYIKPRVEMEKMMDVLKKSTYTNIEDLK